MESADKSCVAATVVFPYTGRFETNFASIHSDPPGRRSDIPAIIVKKYGKGTVIWSAFAVECGKTEEYGDILWSIVASCVNTSGFSFYSDAPANTEITVFGGRGEFLVNCTVLSDEAVSCPVSSFMVKVKTGNQPEKVTLLPGGKEVSFKFKDGYTSFKTRKLDIFDMYRIEM